MSDWEIRRNPDGTIDEIVAHGVDIHLEQLDKNSWAFNVYLNEGVPSQGASAPFLQASLYSKKKVTVFVEEGQDIYLNPSVKGIDEATPPSMENLSKTVVIEDDLEAVAAAVGALIDAGPLPEQTQPPEFIKFPSGEIIP
jgi:hypothetical protein